MNALKPALARLSDERLFLICVAGSLGAHALILETGWQGHLPDSPVEVEFDLTAPGAALGPAGRPAASPARAPAAPTESWTPSTSGAATTPDAEDAATLSPGIVGGTGAGEAGGGSGVTAAPRLLDQGQLDRLLTRYYPESERRQGHEGVVLLDLSIDEEGHVVGVDVVASSDPAFEPAARKAAARLSYAPARAGARAVSVKIRQPVQFRLAPP